MQGSPNEGIGAYREALNLLHPTCWWFRVKSGFPSRTRAIGSIVWCAFRYLQIARPTTRTGFASEAAASARVRHGEGRDGRPPSPRDYRRERRHALAPYQVTIAASEPNFS